MAKPSQPTKAQKRKIGRIALALWLLRGGTERGWHIEVDLAARDSDLQMERELCLLMAQIADSATRGYMPEPWQTAHYYAITRALAAEARP